MMPHPAPFVPGGTCALPQGQGGRPLGALNSGAAIAPGVTTSGTIGIQGTGPGPGGTPGQSMGLGAGHVGFGAGRFPGCMGNGFGVGGGYASGFGMQHCGGCGAGMGQAQAYPPSYNGCGAGGACGARPQEYSAGAQEYGAGPQGYAAGAQGYSGLQEYGAGPQEYGPGAHGFSACSQGFAGSPQMYMQNGSSCLGAACAGNEGMREEATGEYDQDGFGFSLDWQEQRQAEWQERIRTQYFSRWSVDKQDEWQAYQSRFDAADGSAVQGCIFGPPMWDPSAFPTSAETEAAEEYRRKADMQVISAFTAGTVPLPVRHFEAACLPGNVVHEVYQAGFVEPTPIQAQCWPILSAGHDLIGIAKSGSGKTLGFLGPAFTHVHNSQADVQRGPVVLILAPTRELARQIQLEALKFGRSSGILSCAVTGGEPKGEQLEWLKSGCHLIIATPGRLNEFREQEHVWLGQVGYAVLDEADRMLDMGFEPQIRRIIEDCPQGPERQTLLFSATWPKSVRQLAFDFLRRPIHVHIGEMNAAKANTDVTQSVVILDKAVDKDAALDETLTQQLTQGDLAIVFVSTKRACQDVSRRLQSRNFGVAEIHGDKDQRERDIALHSFVQRQKTIMVATDVASRGLDIKGMKLVVNYDAANTPEDHVHRIGRTGRAGEKGLAYTFLVRGDPSDIRKARAVLDVMETAGQRPPEELRTLANLPAPRGGAKGGFKGDGFKGGRGGRAPGKGKGGKRGGKSCGFKGADSSVFLAGAAAASQRPDVGAPAPGPSGAAMQTVTGG